MFLYSFLPVCIEAFSFVMQNPAASRHWERGIGYSKTTVVSLCHFSDRCISSALLASRTPEEEAWARAFKATIHTIFGSGTRGAFKAAFIGLWLVFSCCSVIMVSAWRIDLLWWLHQASKSLCKPRITPPQEKISSLEIQASFRQPRVDTRVRPTP